MPLTMARVGNEHTIVSLNAKGDTKKRLENLGILPGERITLLADRDGDMIIRVKDSRLALNKGMASTIFVN